MVEESSPHRQRRQEEEWNSSRGWDSPGRSRPEVRPNKKPSIMTPRSTSPTVPAASACEPSMKRRKTVTSETRWKT